MSVGFNFNFNTSQHVPHAPANGWAPPTMASVGNSPTQYHAAMKGYTQALEGQFKNAPATMHQHFSGLDRMSQQAVLEHSEKMRDFLGISNPDAFRKLLHSGGETIHYSAAPEALANAATLLSKESRIDRTLARLDATFSEHPLGGQKVRADYKESAEKGFVNLLNNLGNFTSARHKQQAVAIIAQHVQHLDPTARANVAAAARRALTDPTLPSQLEPMLKELTLPSCNKNAGRARFQAKFGMPGSKPAVNKPHTFSPGAGGPTPAPETMGNFGSRMHAHFEKPYDPTGGMTPQKRIQHLRTQNWQDGHVETMKNGIYHCLNAMNSGNPAIANAAIAEYNHKFGHFAVEMNPSTRPYLEALAREMQTDLNSRKPPPQLVHELAQSGWQNHDMQNFKNAIDKCLYAAHTGKPALIIAAVQEYNKTWASYVGPMTLPVATQGFGQLSAALGQHVAGSSNHAGASGSAGATGPAADEAKPSSVPLAMSSFSGKTIAMGPGTKPNDVIAELKAGGFSDAQLVEMRQAIRAYFDTGTTNTSEGRNFAAESKMFDAKYANVFGTSIEADEGKKAFGMLMQKLPREVKTEGSSGSANGAGSSEPAKPAAVPLAVPSFNGEKIMMARSTKPNDVIAQLKDGGFSEGQLKEMRQAIRAYFDTGTTNTSEGRNFAAESKMFDAKYANVFGISIEADEGKLAYGKLMQRLPM